MFHIRSAVVDDAHAIAHVQVDTWHTTYRGIVSDALLATLSYELREQRWAEILSDEANLRGTFVAVDGEAAAGEVVGFAGGGRDRDDDPVYTGELYAIYLRAAQHRRGIGRALVGAFSRWLYAGGHRAMRVWVLPANPACHFYAALGGIQAGKKQIELGGEPYDEIAFGWPDLGALVASLP